MSESPEDKLPVKKTLSESYRDQIEEVITNRRYRKVLASTNTKAVTTVWVVIAVLISLYRYLTM